MAEVILILGISGVGKSTVIRNALERLPEDKRPKWHNFGDLMLEVLKESGESTDRDSMKFFDIEKTKMLQEKVADKISSMTGLVIVDTHMALESPYGFIPGITNAFLDRLKIRQIVIIEARPEDILERRGFDKGKRKRFPENERDISIQLDLDRAMASYLAVKLGVPIKIIENIDLEAAVDELVKSWEGLLWK